MKTRNKKTKSARVLRNSQQMDINTIRATASPPVLLKELKIDDTKDPYHAELIGIKSAAIFGGGSRKLSFSDKLSNIAIAIGDTVARGLELLKRTIEYLF